MKGRSQWKMWAIAMLLLSSAGLGAAQSTTGNAVPHRETAQEMIAKLTPAQKLTFDEACKAYNEKRYEDSLRLIEQLQAELPDNRVLSPYVADCALHAGKRALARELLEPITDSNPDDWQAAGQLARACAELGVESCRDKMMARDSRRDCRIESSLSRRVVYAGRR